MTVKPTKLYFVWRPEEDPQYFQQYDTLEEAVDDNDEPVEVYEADLKLVGNFESKMVYSKVKAKKK